MSLDQLMKEALRDLSNDVIVPTDLASAALRRRRSRHLRQRLTVVGALLATAAAAAIPTIVVHESHHHSAPATNPKGVGHLPAPSDWAPLPPSPTHPDETAIVAHQEQPVPVDMIAVGPAALATYQLGEDGPWYLLNTTTNKYEKTRWWNISVAPGLRLAAVLEQEGAKRIGIVDTSTMAVIRWLPVPKQLAAVTWSPDGAKIAATAFGTWADAALHSPPPDVIGPIDEPMSRIGLYIVDTRTGATTYSAFKPAPTGDGNMLDGAVWIGADLLVVRDYYDDRVSPSLYFRANGELAAKPHMGIDLNTLSGAGLSPDGKLYVSEIPSVPQPNGKTMPNFAVEHTSDGSVVRSYLSQFEQVTSWAGNDIIIAFVCTGSCANEFDNHLEAVRISDDTRTALTGPSHSHSDSDGGHILPVFVQR